MSETHLYISTACQHALHDRCRERCKFCDAKCQCTQCSHSALAQPSGERTAACYPTPDEINALPDKFRQYIHDLETRCDKSGDVQTMALLREDREALQKRVEELESGLEGLLPKHDFGLFLEHNAHRGHYEPAEMYLRDADDGDISKEMRKRCIETNQIWKLQWCPDNATSFYSVYAPTLRELLEAAKDE
jgi:hypothetical protein